MITDTPVELPLRAIADASGTATAFGGGVPPWKVWRIRSTAVTSDSTNRTAVVIYRNSVSAANIIDNSAPYSGNGDTSDTTYDIRSGEQVIIQWTGASPGANCAATISGTQVDQ